jgi:hypothetical protein
METKTDQFEKCFSKKTLISKNVVKIKHFESTPKSVFKVSRQPACRLPAGRQVCVKSLFSECAQHY